MNMEALSKWIGHIPGDVLQDMAHIAPMLARLGYDPYANPPNYGHPDPLVVNNTHRVSVAAVCLSAAAGGSAGVGPRGSAPTEPSGAEAAAEPNQKGAGEKQMLSSFWETGTDRHAVILR